MFMKAYLIEMTVQCDPAEENVAIIQTNWHLITDSTVLKAGRWAFVLQDVCLEVSSPKHWNDMMKHGKDSVREGLWTSDAVQTCGT